MNPLFLSHDASQTGAPVVLLNYLRWLRAQTHSDPVVLLGGAGPRLQDFEDTSRCLLAKHAPFQLTRPTPAARFSKEWTARQMSRLKPQGRIPGAPELSTVEFDLVYANTVATGPLYNALPSTSGLRDLPLVVHVHEQASTIKQHEETWQAKSILERADFIIAASQSVADQLVLNFQVPTSHIEVINEFIDRPAQNPDCIEVRELFGIPKVAPIITGAGSIGFRKGFDLFCSAAVQILRDWGQKSPMSEAPHFIWLGAGNSDLIHWAKHDLHTAGYDQHLHLPGLVPSIAPYLAVSSVFAMPSREDPFPLVNIEAGLHGLPVVAFNDSGGSADYVSKTGGRMVRYGDTVAMASEITSLLEPACWNQSDRDRATAAVVKNFTTDSQAPKIFKLLEGLVRTH